ncbi:MAG: glycoside hydrolase family 13 protein [Ruminococcaceae bacterium]|nr:glycoside hydrolase family 13 protein [Oscillospiraceae bacterium]
MLMISGTQIPYIRQKNNFQEVFSVRSLRICASEITGLEGSIEYLHNGKDIGSGAFQITEKAELRILLPRAAGVVSAFSRIYDQSLTTYRDVEAILKGSSFDHDSFTVSLENIPIGLYYMSLVINTPAGLLYGMNGGGGKICLSASESGKHFQISMVDFKYCKPNRYRGGIIYHVFVDRFARGGNIVPRSDAVMIEDWDNGIPEYPEYPGAHLENNTFFGGTLYGIIDKLDYIKSLGADLIYLSPIFESYSNHKYDTANYMKVDDMFGGDEALSELIREASLRGMGIILDGVFNHTGSDSIYFNKNGKYPGIGAYQSEDSPYYSWYDFKKHPDKYTCWWGIKILPRINPDVKECGDYIAGEGGVIDRYASMGIAGFRLDVADELSDRFISRIKSMLESKVQGSLLYGEVWEDASNKISYDKRKRYYLGSELDGVMNYPVRSGIISFIRDKNSEPLKYALGEVTFNAPKRIRDMQMNLLGTHDTERIITILADDGMGKGKNNAELSVLKLSPSQLKRGVSRLKMAYTILATIPGIPAIFYGDEAGLQGYKDPFNRRPYPWKNQNTEILEYYRAIGKIRRENDAYTDGDFRILLIDNEHLIFERKKNGVSLVTAVNNSDTPISISFGKEAAALIDANVGRDFVIKSGSAEIYKISGNFNINAKV